MPTFTESKSHILHAEHNTFNELWCFTHTPSGDREQGIAHDLTYLMAAEQYVLVPGHLVERFVSEYPLEMRLNEEGDRYESDHSDMRRSGYAFAQKLKKETARECVPYLYWGGNAPVNLRRYYMTAWVKGKLVDSLRYEPINYEKFWSLANQFGPLVK